MPPNPPVSTQNAASSSDQLTAFKNITIAVNNLAQTFIGVHGNQTFTNITAPTVVLNGAGRCCYVSVITPGCAYGTIYDAYQLTDLSRPLYMIPPSYGLVFLDMAVQYGILVVPAPASGSTPAQGVTVSFSGATRTQ